MSKQHPECPLLNPYHCKDFYSQKLCAIVRDDNVCQKVRPKCVSKKSADNTYKKSIYQMITDLEKKGLTQEQMADHMNRKGFATLSGRSKWTKSKIGKLFHQMR